MTPCSSNHPPIAYEGEECPLCRTREALQTLRDCAMRLAIRLDSEPGNQLVVAGWMHRIQQADAVLKVQS